MTSNMHSNPVKYLIIFMAKIRDHAVSPKFCDSEGKNSHWQSRATYICIVVLVHYDSSIFTLIWIAFLCTVAGHVLRYSDSRFETWFETWMVVCFWPIILFVCCYPHVPLWLITIHSHTMLASIRCPVADLWSSFRLFCRDGRHVQIYICNFWGLIKGSLIYGLGSTKGSLI